VGIAVRAGAPRPDLTSADAVKRALLSAKSVAYSTGLSGIYVADLFQRLGIAEELKPKLKQVQGVPIGEIVARGEAELGFHQMSELFPVAGIQSTPLPDEIRHTIYFAAGVPAAAREPEAARALARFLTTPAAASAIRKTGLDPG
jgi:molybdate transport system substrate-binding protein